MITSKQNLPPASCRVVCVCGGYGFPFGNASAARITMVGRALLDSGLDFSLLHCGPSAVAANTNKSGIHEGIRFEYTTAVRRPANRLARLIAYTRGIAVLTAKLIRLAASRPRTLIYLYIMDGPINLYVSTLCRLLGIPVVQELCEWLPGDPLCSRFTRWLYRSPIFRRATGVLAISKIIEERVAEHCRALRTRVFLHRMPAVVDFERFAADAETHACDWPDDGIPDFVYCGTWLRDMRFLIRTFALVKAAGYVCRLRIVGFPAQDNDLIRRYALSKGLSADDLILMGSVDDRVLKTAYRRAAALLLPLPDDDRSRTRLPNKLSEYLAVGRPVVACRIGDLTDYLSDGVNAYLAHPGDEADFADKMADVLRNPEQARRIGAAGQQVCVTQLDYRVHSAGLTEFFLACMNCVPERRAPRREPRRHGFGYMLLRNAFCSLVALGLIAAGQARRARQRAFAEGAASAIYFHTPNGELFRKCVRWLRRNGYTFVSEDDIANMLTGALLPAGSVWLSLDDGFREILQDVVPVIRREHVPATFFIPAGIVGGNGLLPWLHQPHPGVAIVPPEDRDTITVEELQQVARFPEVTIGSHTVNHSVTARLDDRETRFELADSKRLLELWTGSTVNSFAYPEGKHSDHEQAVLKELGYRFAATTENALVTPSAREYLLPRFSVADSIWLPEAICNMVGIWHPAMMRLNGLLRRNRLAMIPAPQNNQTSV